MLREIRCSAFGSTFNGVVQNKILFHSGLNIVCGGDDGDNSIGKTTFLNIIDFVFGSEHYPTEDVLKNVGHHSIEFLFVFDGEKFYFSRSTQTPNIVACCNQDYQKISEKEIKEFRLFLALKYSLTVTGLSFREALCCYVRVYNKKQNQSNDPLKIQGDSKGKSLERLLKLFGKYTELADLLNKKNLMEGKRKAYREAEKYEIVEKITIEQKRKNDKRIEELKNDLKRYELENYIGYNKDSSMVEELSNDIKIEIAKFKRQRNKIKANLSLVNQNQEIISSKLKDKLDDLKEFFPNVNFQKIEKIEKFHEDLKTILSPNIDNVKRELIRKLKEIDLKIEEIYCDLQSSKPSETVNKALFHQYARKFQELENLLRANKVYDESKSIEFDYKDARKKLKTAFDKEIRSIEFLINDKLENSNECVCGKSISTPKFIIQGFNRYCFINEKDEGTGANDRGILQFHLAILELSNLPILIEDSLYFKNIEDEYILKLLELFSQTSKQIFVALDKANHYSKSLIIPRILQNNVVLKLANGNELFGKAWNKND